MPKNGAILFRLRAGEISEQEFHAQVQIRASAGSGALSGSLERAIDYEDGDSVWRWRPDGEMPVGELHVTVRLKRATDVAENAYVIPIADELLALPKVAFSIEASRDLRGEPGSPQIRCIGLSAPECFNPPAEIPIATKWFGVPYILFKPTEEISSAQLAFTSMHATIFSRDPQGRPTVLEDRELRGPAGSAEFDRPDANYCVAVAVTSLMDPGLSDRVETCIPHGSLDLSVSAPDQTAHVTQQLRACRQHVYPNGYSDEHPAGDPEAVGCSCTSSASAGRTDLTPLLVVASLVLRRARRRRSMGSNGC